MRRSPGYWRILTTRRESTKLVKEKVLDRYFAKYWNNDGARYLIDRKVTAEIFVDEGPGEAKRIGAAQKVVADRPEAQRPYRIRCGCARSGQDSWRPANVSLEKRRSGLGYRPGRQNQELVLAYNTSKNRTLIDNRMKMRKVCQHPSKNNHKVTVSRFIERPAERSVTIHTGPVPGNYRCA